MKKLLLLLLMAGSALGATSYTEFYCNATTGNNLNSGSTATAPLTNYAGTWVSATGVFTPTAGNPSGDGVTVGMWASLYTTSGATNANYIALITNVSTTTLTVSQVAFAGTNANVATGAGAATCVIGGPWKGPNTNQAASAWGFPFNFAAGTMTNNPNVTPCINFLAGLYSTTNAITPHSQPGPLRFQGYTNTVRDGGLATIDGTWAGASFILLVINAVNTDFVNFHLQNNGASGQANGLQVGAAAECFTRGCVVNNMRGWGINGTATTGSIIESEVYSNNLANAANIGGIQTSGALLLRCFSHDNTNANASGFFVNGAGGYAEDCVVARNGSDGFLSSSTTGTILRHCDAYANAGNGLNLTGTSATSVIIENCNFVKNTLFGVTSSGSSLRNGTMINCGFGSGTMVNGSGAIASNMGGINEIGTITYAANATPWNAPDTGDFRIVLTAAKSAGNGNFYENLAGFTGTVGYPDIGAAQSSSTNSTGGGTVGYGFAQ